MTQHEHSTRATHRYAAPHLALGYPEQERLLRSRMRALTDQAFARAAGAGLVEGNSVRLLRDAQENYPAWLAAIDAARRYVHFENYIIRDDDTGRMFAEAFIRKAQEGVPVRLIYDWLGCFGEASRRFWNRLRDGGVEVRCYNPPHLGSPFGWLLRDHRKMLVVDGDVAFVAGLCVGNQWVGNPEKNVAPWRDTGIELRGPAVAEVERAFAETWATMGPPLPADDFPASEERGPAGDVRVRVVATVPATAGMLRLDQLVAALARERLWLTDAYYTGTTTYVQALRAAARDGVDVRLLVPNATDIPILHPLSRAGYRPLLEAGVRIFEWNGTMLHAKTAVADGRWARIGSSNLNLQTWLGNCELDVAVEDERFAREMEEMYVQDLENATEIVLDARHRPRAPGRPPRVLRVGASSGSGNLGRAATGALRIGSTVGAAFTNRRTLEPVEARIMVTAGLLLLGLAVLFAFFPRLLLYPVVVLFAWIAVALLYKAYELRRKRTAQQSDTPTRPSQSTTGSPTNTRPR